MLSLQTGRRSRPGSCCHSQVRVVWMGMGWRQMIMVHAVAQVLWFVWTVRQGLQQAGAAVLQGLPSFK